METEKLLAEFPPVSTGEWEAAIAADLKGSSYEEKLIWRAPEGIAVKPYYRAEDLSHVQWTDAAPGSFPFVRGPRAQAGWRIREEIVEADAAEANRAAVSAMAAGAEEIAFRGITIGNVSELALLLIDLDKIPVHFAAASEPLLRLLLALLKTGRSTSSVSAGCDPLGHLDLAAEVLRAAPPDFVPFAIDVSRAAPAGQDAIAQTGWALAAGVDFLGAMEERSIAADRAAGTVEFGFQLGANYFFEIARLRAFRMLWARVVESFGGPRASAKARIAACTAYPETPADKSHWNMLRGATEAMAAILGGADSVCVRPFEQGSEAARRLARNTQLLLKHEAFLSRVSDPGGGSYYLEKLTDEIAERAWKTMQEIEANGGYRVSLRG